MARPLMGQKRGGGGHGQPVGGVSAGVQAKTVKAARAGSRPTARAGRRPKRPFAHHQRRLVNHPGQPARPGGDKGPGPVLPDGQSAILPIPCPGRGRCYDIARRLGWAYWGQAKRPAFDGQLDEDIKLGDGGIVSDVLLIL